jgi:hypothetical protein
MSVYLVFGSFPLNEIRNCCCTKSIEIIKWEVDLSESSLINSMELEQKGNENCPVLAGQDTKEPK